MEFVTNSPQETQNLGERLAKKFQGRTVALFGQLGSGKTNFVQGLALGLGIKKRILSPTFIFIRPYDAENFYHIDLYRLENGQKGDGLGLEEILAEPNATVAIEWPEKIEAKLKNPVKIYFEKISDETRRIKVID